MVSVLSDILIRSLLTQGFRQVTQSAIAIIGLFNTNAELNSKI